MFLPFDIKTAVNINNSSLGSSLNMFVVFSMLTFDIYLYC